MSFKDRESFDNLWKTSQRNTTIQKYLSFYLGFETVRLVPLFRSWALGWRVLTVLSLQTYYTAMLVGYTSQWYQPLFSAYLNKYKNAAKSDLFDIQDEKKKYFMIDTSQYMNYSLSDVSDEYHVNHGPQPIGEAMDSSYLAEVDKFLRGEPNNLKGHKRFLDYDFEFSDKSFPSADKVADLMHKKN
mmetsp:Transcript_13281/g.22541  ORF Transcript_13281/g.22541 Transcript_13281/m.22541 type:complete len:186 (-) Transcript_13281:307-864(-)|eukprot:CAMPEP_0168616750 /NCGR_PEP_ID=MMETSP0449_2-20121227/5185_1 /TAXON_ID=1082188 /ORGANISM="Strombidium rassoulzadegani, Strain ras09" /LENGTH=185 /DNA_ID=CAMNT_0008657539 /DNA_START=167 /DNA_END=724 /DNA_ORIENTATION=+